MEKGSRCQSRSLYKDTQAALNARSAHLLAPNRERRLFNSSHDLFLYSIFRWKDVMEFFFIPPEENSDVL